MTPASEISAQDVLCPNARTRRAFDGQIAGSFEPAGPNAWDGFRFVPADGGSLRVFPGIRVQVERTGTAFRMRAKGKVLRVAWIPDPELEGASPPGLRAAFLDRCVTGFREAGGVGAQAFLAKSLLR